MGFFSSIGNIISKVTPWNDDSTLGKVANVATLGIMPAMAVSGVDEITPWNDDTTAGKAANIASLLAAAAVTGGAAGYGPLAGAMGGGTAGAAAGTAGAGTALAGGATAAPWMGLGAAEGAGTALAGGATAAPWMGLSAAPAAAPGFLGSLGAFASNPSLAGLGQVGSSALSAIGPSGLIQGGLGIASYLSAEEQAEAAQRAAQSAQSAQFEGTRMGIDEMRRQFDVGQAAQQPFVTAGAGALQGLQPYQQAGQQAFQGQQNLIGMGGPEAQQSAINQLAQSPQFQAMFQQGENAMLQNASATGGLRGGNIQGALAQFRPQMLNELINQQYSRLGGMSAAGLGAGTNVAQLGQAAAGQQAAAGLNTGRGLAGLYEDQGTAGANLAYAQGGIQNAQSRQQMAALTGLGNMFTRQFGQWPVF